MKLIKSIIILFLLVGYSMSSFAAVGESISTTSCQIVFADKATGDDKKADEEEPDCE